MSKSGEEACLSSSGESEFALPPPVTIQALSGLREAHPNWGWRASLLSSPIKGLIS